jgi:hypothetical protein
MQELEKVGRGKRCLEAEERDVWRQRIEEAKAQVGL